MKFQHVRHKKYKLDYGWMLVIEDIASLINYHYNVLKADVPKAFKNYIDVIKLRSHVDNRLLQIMSINAMVNVNDNFVELLNNVSLEMFSAKYRAISKSGKIYIGKEGGWFAHYEDIDIIDTKEINDVNLIYPNYTENDIRIIRWPDGKHWYAHVGNFEVINLDGERKWNTYAEANRQANYFLYRLNNNEYIVN